MTDEERSQYLEMLRRIKRERQEKQILDTLLDQRRRSVRHKIYSDMGFEVVTDRSLDNGLIVDVKAKFVDVDPDFYTRD